MGSSQISIKSSCNHARMLCALMVANHRDAPLVRGIALHHENDDGGRCLCACCLVVPKYACVCDSAIVHASSRTGIRSHQDFSSSEGAEELLRRELAAQDPVARPAPPSPATDAALTDAALVVWWLYGCGW